MNLKPEELVKALRFCGKHECITCPRDIDECSQMVYTAAEQIERDQKEIAELRKELEWKDMVITLAQKKQTEAEAERDKLREENERLARRLFEPRLEPTTSTL